MNNLILTILITVFTVTGLSLKAQDAVVGKQTVEIKTSAQCEMCKTRLEKAFAYEKGVKSSELNVETAVFTVTYLPKKTNLEKLKVSITKIGYDADDLKANEKAYKELPGCCQKGGMH